MDMQKLLLVGAGGFLGAALRYAVSSWTAKALGPFPLGTLLVNVAGGFLMGFLMQASLNLWPFSANTRVFLTTGILGGLTTFSTFSYESVSFFNSGRYGLFAVNVCANLFLALLACWLGGTVVKAIASA